MQPNHRLDNPFAMMLDPQAVLARVAHSERLARLQRRICRPLDKPLLGGPALLLPLHADRIVEGGDASHAD